MSAAAKPTELHIPRATLKQALTALEQGATAEKGEALTQAAIKVLRQALAAPTPKKPKQAIYGYVWVDEFDGGCFVYGHEAHPKDARAVCLASDSAT